MPKLDHGHIERGKGNLAMNKQLMTGAAQAVAIRTYHELSTDADFLAVLAFTLIGVLLALNLVVRFPDLGAVIAQYNQF